MRFTAISLFCGCGGLDLGFVESGFDIGYACDKDPAAVACFNRNIGAHAVQRDVTSESFHQEVKGLPPVDVVLGGFPCQGFSKAGPKNFGDSRNLLYEEMKHAVETIRPPLFLAENVDGISQNFRGRFVHRIVSDFSNAGYSVTYRTLNALGFGVPQHRRRVIFAGVRQDLGTDFPWPTPTHQYHTRNGESPIQMEMPLFDQGGGDRALPAITIRDAISDLPELGGSLADHAVTGSWPQSYEAIFRAIGPGQKLCDVRFSSSSVHSWEIPEAFGAVSSDERLFLETLGMNRRHKKYGCVPNGNPLPAPLVGELAGLEDAEKIAVSLVSKGYLKKVEGRYDIKGATFCSGLFKRPLWDEPAPTVLTNFHNPRYFLHPQFNRPFTLRECCRLQGFPDTFVVSEGMNGVSLIDGYRLIGNAVPPPLAAALASSTRRCLEAVGGLGNHHATSI